VTLEAPMRCSALAEELDEPMIGTVDQRVRWLLVEDHSAWGHDAVGDVLGAELAVSLKERRVRALLIRRREGDPAVDAVRRAILVDTVSRRMVVRALGDLADLAMNRVADAPLAEFGAPMTDPIFLVCTNGKRDACCALRGRALMSALAPSHAERTWECTHLGGHRFAGNLVCLPDGILYGRVSAADGPHLADAYLDGRLDARALRGRSAWPQPAQVAERALRLSLELDGLDAVALERVDLAGDRATIKLAATATGAEHEFELARDAAGEPRPTSCRADELETPMHWRVVASTI
jgi:hypothetical protein